MTTPSRSISPDVFLTPRGRDQDFDGFSTPGASDAPFPGPGTFQFSSERLSHRARTPETPTRAQGGIHPGFDQSVIEIRTENVSYDNTVLDNDPYQNDRPSFEVVSTMVRRSSTLWYLSSQPPNERSVLASSIEQLQNQLRKQSQSGSSFEQNFKDQQKVLDDLQKILGQVVRIPQQGEGSSATSSSTSPSLTDSATAVGSLFRPHAVTDADTQAVNSLMAKMRTESDLNKVRDNGGFYLSCLHFLQQISELQHQLAQGRPNRPPREASSPPNQTSVSAHQRIRRNYNSSTEYGNGNGYTRSSLGTDSDRRARCQKEESSSAIPERCNCSSRRTIHCGKLPE